MDNNEIISRINTFLHDATKALATWLSSILPRVSNTWWDDCVISSLSYNQREIALEKHYAKLEDFDLAALLRITNKSWYDMRTVAYLPSSERECIRDMINVRNNWAHCSAELPDKDTILHDLSIIDSFFEQVNGEQLVISEIHDLIKTIELPDSISRENNDDSNSYLANEDSCSFDEVQTPKISINSLVYLVGAPTTRGIVCSIDEVDHTEKYSVFVDGAIRTFFFGQIALVEDTTGYNWVDINSFRSMLTAYQINNPSAQNLYSLNSARIDFVPYQFRPALKLIHADEPRVLIADSVGVGKTIEAGLIIKELEARSELERVIVICPRPLVAERKWELEMKRFDEEFIPLDGSSLRQAISDTDRDGDWPVRYNKAILPYSILDSRIYNGEISKRSRTFGLSKLDPAPHFDLVIVDEAHHIRKGSMDKEKAYAYKCTKFFCDHADAVIMLTATPLQTGDDDLFTLLNVLRPDVVIDQKTFTMMSRPNEYISKAAHIIRTAQDNWAVNAIQELIGVRKTQWGDTVISDNPLYDDILNRLEQIEITREQRVKLISDVESLHSFNTMINRTRRRDIQDFCVRHSYTVSTEFTERQHALHDELLLFEESMLSMLHDERSVPFMMSTIKRQAASCIFGLAPHIRDIINRRFRQMNDDPDIESADFDLNGSSADSLSQLARHVLLLADNLPEEDPKFDKMLEIIMKKHEQTNHRIMLFSTFQHTLSYLNRKLSEYGLRIGQVDGSVKDEQRYELKSRFELQKEDPNAIDVLLFTEVGSEGLDYQFCDTMINYDLPWNPMKIEQRIGRIDRRGQQSEAVNIYNIITENTIDADIYYRCLMRIGVFEKSIGECEEILGEIASEIESIAVDTKLTDVERKQKIAQMSDNEVRKMQEINRLEEEEKELFGFDLSEFTTAQEIKKAENPWLTQQYLQCLIEQYLKDRVGIGASILGDGAMKNIRLSATARETLREDARKLPGSKNALRNAWDAYLSGRVPNHAITFNSDAAEKDRNSFFITAMHPLAKQAAHFYSSSKALYLSLELYSNTLAPGDYDFSVYAWRFLGLNTYFRLVTVCENDSIAAELPDILENAASVSRTTNRTDFDWTPLEEKHIRLWKKAAAKHKEDVNASITFRLESLTNNYRNRIRALEQQINDAIDDSIRRMRMSEIESVQEAYQKKSAEMNSSAARADVHTILLANGVITVRRG